MKKFILTFCAIMIAAPAVAKPTVNLDLDSFPICSSIERSAFGEPSPVLKWQLNWQYTKKLKDYIKGKTCFIKSSFHDGWNEVPGDYIYFDLYCECEIRGEKGWASVASSRLLDLDYLRGGQ